MLTINLLFIRIGITIQEKTLEEERHFQKVKENRSIRETENISKQPWLF